MKTHIFKSNDLNVEQMKQLILENEHVHIEIPYDDKESGMILTRNNSHYFGFKLQPTIEVRYYEKEDGHSYYCMGTEYFNLDMVDNSIKALISRYHNSTDPVQPSTFSIDFDSTFEKDI